MTGNVVINQMKSEIEALFQTHSGEKKQVMEKYLQKALQDCSPTQKTAVLDALIRCFSTETSRTNDLKTLNEKELSSVISLLLGKPITTEEYSAEELLEKFSRAFNTVFDALNELIGTINTTFMGKTAEDKTIRLMITADLENAEDMIHLKHYLERIREAFLIMYDAFKQAALVEMKRVLAEINPEVIAEQVTGGLKVGPFKKAEMFELYESKFHNLDNWLQKGLSTEALLRKFESIAEELLSKKKEKYV